MYFFNVSPSKEDIFSEHYLSPVFHFILHITITNFHETSEGSLHCIPVNDLWVLKGFCLLFCADIFILNCQTSLQFVHHAYWAKHPEVLIFLWRLSLDDVGDLRFVWKLALRACFVQSEIKTSIPSYFIPKLKCNLFTNNKNTVTIQFQTIQFPKIFEWRSMKWMVTFSFFQKINSVFLIKI